MFPLQPLSLRTFLRTCLGASLGVVGCALALAPVAAQPQPFPITIERSSDTGSLLDQLQPVRNNGTASPQRDQGDQLVRLGDQHYRQGAYAKAIATWRQALALYQDIGDDEGIGVTLDLIGLTYGDRGDYPEAEQALRQRLSIARLRKDFQGQLYALNNLGTMLIQGGRGANLDAAEVAFDEARTIAEDIGDLEGQGLSLSNLGLVAQGRGEYAKAVKRYEEALLFRQRGDNPAGELNTLNNLGHAYWSLQDYDEAIGAYGAALNLAETLEKPYAQLRAMDGLITAHGTVGRVDRAMDLMTERLTVAQDLGDIYQQFLAVKGFYTFYRSQGELRTARSFLERTIGLAQVLEDTQAETLLLDELLQLNLTLAADR
ncbi:tetratricopeptide repeat protein [Prochlorothrix hollandica]|uniref:tetratricopeptide repeat protein n=1 Tax=Prochlorothrix hollandica TaxID=1223 RepID=UPI00333F0941